MTARPASPDLEDDGTAERAGEIAAGWIATAWYRRTKYENANGGELMLSLADHCRSHITQEQWRELLLAYAEKAERRSPP